MDQDDTSRLGAEVICRLSLRHQAELGLAAIRGMKLPEGIRSELTGIEGGRAFLEATGPGISPPMLAGILDRLDPFAGARLTKELDRVDPGALKRLEDLRCSFEDVEGLHIEDVRKLLHGVDERTVFLALEGASPAIWGKVFSALSPDSAIAMQHKLTISASDPLPSVQEAQARIVSRLRGLIEAGVIGKRAN